MTINGKPNTIAGKVVATIVTYAFYIVVITGVAVGLFYWGVLLHDWVLAIISR